MSVIERVSQRLATNADHYWVTAADLRALLAVVEAAERACGRLEGFCPGSWEDGIARPLRTALSALEAPDA